MAKMQIIKILNNEYSLLDIADKKQYKFNLYFYGLSETLQVWDFLIFHKELLDSKYEEYDTTYQFGPLNEQYGRSVTTADDIDLIAVLTNNKKIYLKRFFG